MKIFLFLFLLSLVGSCKKDPKEKLIKEAIDSGDHLQLAIVCADYKGKKYKDSCLEGKQKAEEEILKLISRKKENPFFKLIIEKETSRKITELLKKDILLGIKYRSIWKETSEEN